MATIVQKVSSIYYLVTLGYVLIDRPGTEQDINYQEVIGSYETLEDAKQAVEANAYRIMDNDNQYLKLYKVDLEENKLHTFYRKDLQAPIQKALKAQKEQDAKSAEKTKLELQKEGGVKKRPGRDVPALWPDVQPAGSGVALFQYLRNATGAFQSLYRCGRYLCFAIDEWQSSAHL